MRYLALYALKGAEPTTPSFRARTMGQMFY